MTTATVRWGNTLRAGMCSVLRTASGVDAPRLRLPHQAFVCARMRRPGTQVRRGRAAVHVTLAALSALRQPDVALPAGTDAPTTRTVARRVRALPPPPQGELRRGLPMVRCAVLCVRVTATCVTCVCTLPVPMQHDGPLRRDLECEWMFSIPGHGMSIADNEGGSFKKRSRYGCGCTAPCLDGR